MSSHHIVRDQQEPALILADVDTFPFDLLGQLLEWAPYTVCGDAVLDQALKYEINLDVVFSDRPYVGEQLVHFPGVEVVLSNENWIEEAILLLASKGHKAVNVVVDDGFSDLDLIHRMRRHLLVDVITPTSKYVRVEQRFSKWMPAGSRLTVVGTGDFYMDGERLASNDITLSKDGVIDIDGESPYIVGLHSY